MAKRKQQSKATSAAEGGPPEPPPRQRILVELALVEVLADGGERVLKQREFGERFTDEKWQRTSITMPNPLPSESTGEVRVVIRGQCLGCVLFRACRVVRAE